MQYILMALMVSSIVALDQFTKYLVVANIGLHQSVPAIPGLFNFTYIQNTGAAWSSFEGQLWLFIVVFALFTAAVVYEFATGKMGFSTFERWCIAAIYAGGLGNMIDRVRIGYVVDMINLEFMNFPVFNVADCFICCGCAALMVSLVFFNKGFWKDGKK